MSSFWAFLATYWAVFALVLVVVLALWILFDWCSGDFDDC